VAVIRPGQTPLIDLENPPDWTRPEWFTDCPNEPHIDTPLHRGRLLLASEMVHDAVENAEVSIDSVVDIGAGDGGLLETLEDLEVEWGTQLWGYDLALPSVEYAQKVRHVQVAAMNVFSEEARWGDLCVATEFIEHMVDPHGTVEYIAERSRWIVASSPFTETLDAHYPLHTWAFTLDGYKALLEDAGYTVIRQETVDMFQVLLGQLPR